MFPALLPSLIGATGLSTPTVLQFINLAAGVVAAGIDTVARLRALDAQVAGFVAEGRDPTEEEWAALIDRSDAAHDRIQAEADRRSG